jgi:hypothetical protein
LKNAAAIFSVPGVDRTGMSVWEVGTGYDGRMEEDGQFALRSAPMLDRRKTEGERSEKLSLDRRKGKGGEAI